MTFSLEMRAALRKLRQRPGAWLLAAVALGAGLGVAASMYALVHAVVLRPLPVQDADRVVVAWGVHTTRGIDHFPFSADAWERVRDESRVLAAVAGTESGGASERLIEEADGSLTRSRWSRVLGDYFGVLGVRPHLGRLTTADDDVPGGAHLAVVSHRLWQRRWQGSAVALGDVLRIDGVAYTVVGVAPPEFDYPRGTEVWTPLQPAAPQFRELDVVARLAPGGTPEQLSAELRQLFSSPGLPEFYRDVEPVVQTLPEVIFGDLRSAVLLLLTGALLLFVIAAANVTNLVALRRTERTRELAIRRALGASPGTLRTGPATEAAAITAIAMVVAAVVAFAVVPGLLALTPGDLPRVADLRPGFETTAALATGTLLAFVLIVWLPTVMRRGGAAVDTEALRTATGNPPRPRGQRLLLGGQTALAVWAVAAAALLGRTLLHLQHLDRGFEIEALQIVQLDHSHPHFAVPASFQDRLEAVIRVIEATPGVRAATPLLTPPLSGRSGFDVVPTLEAADHDGTTPLPYLNLEVASVGHFGALGMTVLAGRTIREDDREGAPPVAVVNVRTAETLWPGRDPIGRRIRLPFPGFEETWFTVVGVVGDSRYRSLTEVRPSIYVPPRQLTVFAPRYVGVRADPDVPLAAAVRRALQHAPDLRFVSVTGASERMAGPLERPRFAAAALSATAILILVLATLGVYGVTAAGVGARQREMGIRLAIGGRPADVGRLVVLETLAVVGIGVAAGLAAATVTGRLASGLLYGVTPVDAVSYGFAIATVLGAALLASVPPALRAAATDPMSVMRVD